MKAKQTVSLMLAALLLVQPALLSAANKDEDKPQFQEKFIWGVLGKTVLSSVFGIFTKWLNQRLSGGTPQAKPECPTTVEGQTSLSQNSGSSADAEAPLPSDREGLKRHLKREVVGAVIVELAKFVFGGKSFDARSFSAKDSETVVGTPAAPFRSVDGKPNYHGIHIAIVAVDKDGKALGYHSVNQGFRTGQRFKLRVMSTFDGLLAIDNINPNGVQRRIYPAKQSQVVSLKAGEEVLLPLDKNQAFQFTGARGQEQLLIALRHPKAIDEGASRNPVYRRDELYGSNLVQEVAHNTYPAIFQSIKLQHD